MQTNFIYSENERKVLPNTEYLYHATPSCYVSSIKRYGLGGRVPEKRFWDYKGTPYENITRGCFLCDDEYAAESYIEVSDAFFELSDEYMDRYDRELEIVVFRVKVSDLDPDLLSIDKNNMDNDEYASSFFYDGIIPYEKLTRVSL